MVWCEFAELNPEFNPNHKAILELVPTLYGSWNRFRTNLGTASNAPARFFFCSENPKTPKTTPTSIAAMALSSPVACLYVAFVAGRFSDAFQAIFIDTLKKWWCGILISTTHSADRHCMKWNTSFCLRISWLRNGLVYGSFEPRVGKHSSNAVPLTAL